MTPTTGTTTEYCSVCRRNTKHRVTYADTKRADGTRMILSMKCEEH